jgi:hypothetical protein
MENMKELGEFDTIMGKYFKELLKKEIKLWENIQWQTEAFTKATTKKIYQMVLVNFIGLMDKNIEVIGETECKKEKVFKHLKMENK